jgi:ribonuclease III
MVGFTDFNDKNKCITREDINKITGFNPINVLFYQQAFIHKSVLRFLNETDSLKTSYERYEFLGDSILNLIVAKYIFNKYPDKEEGFLTRIRTKLVNGKTLAFLSKKINLGEFLIISKNVENIGGRNNDRILEDIFEAFLCSIHNDLGFKYTEYFVVKLINEYIDDSEIEEDTNYKDILLRHCQQHLHVNPTYKLVSTTGPAHNKTFTSVVIINKDTYSEGTGKNKKISEQLASKFTLENFGYKF